MNHEHVEKFIQKLESFTISDYNGLYSPGMTCYLNCVLQVLFMTEDFREAVKRCCSKDSKTIEHHLGRLFSDLQKGVAQTHNITKQLGITDAYEQRDAAEYFEKILSLTNPEATKLFKGELNHKSTCLNCKDISHSKSFFWVLPLAVEDLVGRTYSVEEGLKAFFKGEKMCGDNKMFCKCCNTAQDAKFKCEVKQSPDILTLLLKRFSFDYKLGCYVKLDSMVDVPQTLNIENSKYELYAIVNHFGNLTGGHYTAHIKSFETQVWYHFNDAVVKMVRGPLCAAGDKSMRSCSAYLLMYKKLNSYSKRTDEEDREAAHSDVEGEGRCDEADKGEALVSHHRRRGESCNGSGHLELFTAHVSKRSLDDAVFDEIAFRSTKEKNGGAEWVSPLEEMVLQRGAAGGGENYKSSVNRTSTANLRTHCGDFTFKQNHGSQKKRLQTSETVWETHNNVVTHTETKTSIRDNSLTRNRVRPAEIRPANNILETGVRIQRESDQGGEVDVTDYMSYSDLKSFPVCPDVYVPSSVPYLTKNLPSQFRTVYPTGWTNLINQGRKYSLSQVEEERKQEVLTVDRSCRLEPTQTVMTGERASTLTKKTKSRKSMEKIKKKPWR